MGGPVPGWWRGMRSSTTTQVPQSNSGRGHCGPKPVSSGAWTELEG